MQAGAGLEVGFAVRMRLTCLSRHWRHPCSLFAVFRPEVPPTRGPVRPAWEAGCEGAGLVPPGRAGRGGPWDGVLGTAWWWEGATPPVTARPGRYDVLFMPPSFPFGGMENPCLTFVTPCLLAGDRSLADVIIHEIAHSWFGNLVTNATWGEFWLNEGFTMYAQRRISSLLFGESLRGPVSPFGARQAPSGVSGGRGAGSPGTAGSRQSLSSLFCRTAVTDQQGPGAEGVLGGPVGRGAWCWACLPSG